MSAVVLRADGIGRTPLRSERRSLLLPAGERGEKRQRGERKGRKMIDMVVQEAEEAHIIVTELE